MSESAQVLSIAPPIAQKDAVVKRRKAFFAEIVNILNVPPGRIDDVFMQKNAFVPPSAVEVNDEVMGNLLIAIDFGDSRFHYSVYQTGKLIRIGILMPGSLGDRINTAELEKIFHSKIRAEVRGSKMLFEWIFSEGALYSEWLAQEHYVLGIRHMHFRVMAMLHETEGAN